MGSRGGGASQDRKSGCIGLGGGHRRPARREEARPAVGPGRERARAQGRRPLTSPRRRRRLRDRRLRLVGNAPTAQVAAQQGKYVGRAIRDRSTEPFAYKHAGSLCCLGFGNAIAQLQPQHQAWRSLHSAANTKVVGEDQRAVTGAPAFALRRGMYFTQLLSPSTRWSVSADWIRTSFQGRDVNEPVLKRTMTPAESE